MKHLHIIPAIVVILVMLLTACSTQQKCKDIKDDEIIKIKKKKHYWDRPKR